MKQTEHPSLQCISHRLFEKPVKIFLVNRRKREPRDRHSFCGRKDVHFMCVSREPVLCSGFCIYCFAGSQSWCSSSLCQNSSCFQQKQNEVLYLLYGVSHLRAVERTCYTVIITRWSGRLLLFFCFFPPEVILITTVRFPCIWRVISLSSYFSCLAHIITGFITSCMFKEESYEFSLIKFPAKSQACYLSPDANYLITSMC